MDMEEPSKQERRELRRQRRREKKEIERSEITKSGRKKLIIFGILILSIIVSLGYFVYLINATSRNYDDFAKCLTEKGTVIYGNDWCKFTQQNVGMFGNSFKYLKYVKCDDNPKLCAEKSVVKTPTWEINGEILPGVQSFETLSQISGCKI